MAVDLWPKRWCGMRRDQMLWWLARCGTFRTGHTSQRVRKATANCTRSIFAWWMRPRWGEAASVQRMAWCGEGDGQCLRMTTFPKRTATVTQLKRGYHLKSGQVTVYKQTLGKFLYSCLALVHTDAIADTSIHVYCNSMHHHQPSIILVACLRSPGSAIEILCTYLVHNFTCHLFNRIGRYIRISMHREECVYCHTSVCTKHSIFTSRKTSVSILLFTFVICVLCKITFYLANMI